MANRGAIEDRLAHDFNEVFYREIAAGREVPGAFQTAMAELRQRTAAASWSNLLLLGGQAGLVRTTSR